MDVDDVEVDGGSVEDVVVVTTSLGSWAAARLMPTVCTTGVAHSAADATTAPRLSAVRRSNERRSMTSGS